MSHKWKIIAFFLVFLISLEYICKKITMKTYAKARPRVTITCDTPLSNHEYSKIRRVAAMLEANDMDVVLKKIVVESYELLKTA
jgi:hypothetical protein